MNFKKIQLSLFLFAFSFFGMAQIYNVKDYGAVDDGVTLNTKAIQKAIGLATKNWTINCEI